MTNVFIALLVLALAFAVAGPGGVIALGVIVGKLLARQRRKRQVLRARQRVLGMA